MKTLYMRIRGIVDIFLPYPRSTSLIPNLSYIAKSPKKCVMLSYNQLKHIY